MPSVRLAAPAKINLYLHVTGKRADGYHLLDSLVAFADIGDEIAIEASADFHLSVTGPFRGDVPLHDNIVEKAVRMTAGRLARRPDVHVTLTKNLPVGSGIGGGSSDAAAIVRALLQFFNQTAPVDDILLQLGADVPACYHASPLRFAGIGEEIEMVIPFPALHALLINPGISCATQTIFKTLKLDSFKEKIALPALNNQDAVFRFLGNTGNDLTDAAIAQVAQIKTVLSALEETGAPIVRMSGSGATCFALFDNRPSCEEAARDLTSRYPGWWIKSVRLNASTP